MERDTEKGKREREIVMLGLWDKGERVEWRVGVGCGGGSCSREKHTHTDSVHPQRTGFKKIHSHVKAQVLLLLKEVVQDVLSDKVRV